MKNRRIQAIQLSLSCSFSSFEDGSPHSEPDDTVSMVEPYTCMYEPEAPIHEGSAPTSESDDGESSDEGRTGN